jgi:hypothetical protein
VHWQKTIHMGHQRPNPSGPGLEPFKSQQWIEPYNLMRHPVQVFGRRRQLPFAIAIESVCDQQHRCVLAEYPTRPMPVEFLQARSNPGPTLPVINLLISQTHRDIRIA